MHPDDNAKFPSLLYKKRMKKEYLRCLLTGAKGEKGANTAMSSENSSSFSCGNIIQHQRFEIFSLKDARQWLLCLHLLNHSSVYLLQQDAESRFKAEANTIFLLIYLLISLLVRLKSPSLAPILFVPFYKQCSILSYQPF